MPNVQLAELLADARRRGLSFAEAWDEAIRPGKGIVMTTTHAAPAGALRWPTDRTDRQAWQAAINASRWGWRRAYEREPMTAPERAVAFLSEGFRALDEVSVERAAGEGIDGVCAIPSAA